MKADPDPRVEAPKFVEINRSFEDDDLFGRAFDSERIRRGQERFMNLLILALTWPVLLFCWILGWKRGRR